MPSRSPLTITYFSSFLRTTSYLIFTKKGAGQMTCKVASLTYCTFPRFKLSLRIIMLLYENV